MLNNQMICAFSEELQEIEKAAALGFLVRGFSGLGNMGRMAVQKGGLKAMGGGIKATHTAAGGGMKGVKAVAKQLAAPAAALGVSGAAGYGAYRLGKAAVGGEERQPRVAAYR